MSWSSPSSRFLTAFLTLSCFMGVSVGIAKVTTSLYAVHLGASESMLGVVAGSQSIGILAMSIPLGFLVDRYGPARLFTIGTVVAGTLYLVVPLIPKTEFLVMCTALIGCFMPFRFVSLNTVFLEKLSQMGEGKAGFYRGTHMAGTFLIGPAVAAACVSFLDFRGTYFLISALFALTIVLSPLVFRQLGSAQREPRAMSVREVQRQLVMIVRDPDLRGASMAEFTAQGITMFYGFFIVVIGISELHLSAQSASGLVSAQGLAYVFALFTLGGVARALGQLQAYLASSVVVTLALVVLGLGSSGSQLLVGGSLLGLGVGLLQIVNLMRFARIGGRLGRGKVAGLNALVGPAGGMLGNLLGGLIGHRIGLQSVFLLFIPLVALLCWQLAVSQREVVLEA